MSKYSFVMKGTGKKLQRYQVRTQNLVENNLKSEIKKVTDSLLEKEIQIKN